MTPAGFPHSDIHGSTLESSSPWLFAGCRVLHRLLVPRHPPCALCSLTCCSRLSARVGPVNHRQMGRVRGSFRHHEPYLVASPQARALESHFSRRAAEDLLSCLRAARDSIRASLATLVDGNMLLGWLPLHAHCPQPQSGVKIVPCHGDLPVVLFVY